MNTKITVSIIAVVAVVFAGLFLLNPKTQSLGGGFGQESFSATTTRSTSASATTIVQLKSGFGTLGSVIISSSSPATSYPALKLYNATSTMATSTSEVLAEFGTNNQTEGTYEYNTSFTTGLSVEIPVGFDGIYTVTWK